VDHAQHLPRSFPWRTATVVVAVIAVIELVVLIAIGAARLAPARPYTISAAEHRAAAKTVERAARHVAAIPTHPLRPRAKLSVLVLNGNGVSGAAGAEATTLQTHGYGRTSSQNAPRHDYATSIVMYAPGYTQEGLRLGRDAGVRVVSLVDGMSRAQLKGSQLVVVLGGS
jgi:hypothetical protein